MKAQDLVAIYRADSLVKTLTEGIRTPTPHPFHVSQLHGSLDALLLAAVSKSFRGSHMVVMPDKEEAAYFLNDLQHLCGDKEVLFFPMSYKRPYEYDETENANILTRAEVLAELERREGVSGIAEKAAR